MGLWNGNLRNSPLDILVDSLVLSVIITSYSIQVLRILRDGSTRGISPYFILFNAIYSNFNLANALLLAARAWPTDIKPVLEQTGKGELNGREALGAIFGFVQVACTWAGSIMLVTLHFMYHPNDDKAQVFTLSLLHAMLFLVPAIAIALPRPTPRDFGVDLFTGFSAIIGTWGSLIFCLLQFIPQIRECKRLGGSTVTLSLLSVAFKILFSALLGLRWLQRLGRPTWTREGAPLYVWYQWGWLAANQFVECIGCALLMWVYTRERAAFDVAGEGMPLLR